MEELFKHLTLNFQDLGLFSLPGGDVSALIGFEWRGDSSFDDRDDNLDGTNVYVKSIKPKIELKSFIYVSIHI